MLYQIDWSACADDMTAEKFLAEYWQKKPLLIKRAFANFEDPIEANELAGLAMEDMVQSRIIGQKTDKTWFVEHGPFEDFEQFGENYWTLLVQATNHWSETTQALINPFRFLPNWRIDDVMVSFSTPNGGVGPHLDQYDVFIIQGEGKRHWQVGLPDSNLTTIIPHCDLKQVSEFCPVIDEITEPGDLLYIPPAHPHNGSAIENSLNYSIGFQAPNTQELWSSFADLLIDKSAGETRFGDKNRQVTDAPEAITPNDMEALKAFMLTKLEDETFFNHFICGHLTNNHHELDIQLPEQAFDIEEFDAIIDEIELIKPVLGVKAIYNTQTQSLYVNGMLLDTVEQQTDLAIAVAKGSPLTNEMLKSFDLCLKNKQLLTNLLNHGYWYAE